MLKRKIIAAALLLALAGAAAASFMLDKGRAEIYDTGIFVMDAYCSVSLDKNKTAEVTALLADLDEALDSFDDKSEISQLNREKSIGTDTCAGQLIEESISLQDKFRGRVDITAGGLVKLWGITGDSPRVPSEKEIQSIITSIGREHIKFADENITLDENTLIDTGAVGKGFALDRVNEFLRENDVSYGIVSMTSSMLLYGEKPDGSQFRIAVNGAEGETLGTVNTDSCFISSSGSYERYFTDDDGNKYSHILDPFTGYPVQTDLTAVTVLCGSGIMSDYLSTMIFMEGSGNIEKYLHSEEYKVVAADADGNIYVSDGLSFERKETGGKN